MEEDIKILKELKETQEICIKNTKDSPFTMLWKKQNQAISNILNRLEQDEKIIKEIAKAWKQDDIRSVEDIIDYFRKRCE